jgi:hypothetical protein
MIKQEKNDKLTRRTIMYRLRSTSEAPQGEQ